MAINIKDPETDRLARELAAETGESITEVIRTALLERRERVRRRKTTSSRDEEIEAILQRIWAMPVLDDRTPDELIGYDEDGLPT